LSLATQVALEAAAAKGLSAKRIKAPDFFKWFPSMKRFIENSATYLKIALVCGKFDKERTSEAPV